jgi:hypothetical protein
MIAMNGGGLVCLAVDQAMCGAEFTRVVGLRSLPTPPLSGKTLPTQPWRERGLQWLGFQPPSQHREHEGVMA